MSGFGSHYGVHSTSTPKSPNTMRNNAVKTERRSSQSSSDDGSYGHRSKGDIEQDEDVTLTSQALNADGTPKRPMNAFMIFARRRRPQVSAQNQSMRTGEISKILSKEWVSMPTSDKQFYLEQAKQLKETFNSRYPDYVYRRRPNNSRKRRRSDGTTIRTVDHGLVGDHSDDLGGGFDIDSSPTDDDQLDSALYHRSSHQDMPHGSVEQKFNLNQPRHYSSDNFRSNGEGHRLPYPVVNGSDRVGPGNPSSGMSQNSVSYSYQSSGHGQSPPLYSDSQQNWQHRGSWVGDNQDRLGSHAPKSSYSPPGSWSPHNESTSSPSSGPSSYFPTLTTPFYPNQTYVSSSNSNSQGPHQPSSTSHYESVPSKEYNRSYGGSSLARDSFMQRTLPPMQVSGYPPSPLTNSGPPSSSLWRG